MPYGQRWRRYRRMFWQHFYPKAVAEYRPVQQSVARNFIRKLLDDPARFKEHLRQYVTSSATIVRSNTF